MVCLEVLTAIAPPAPPPWSQIKTEIIATMKAAGISPPYRFTFQKADGASKTVGLDSFDGIGVLPLRDMPPTREEMLADLSTVLRFTNAHHDGAL